MKSSTLVLLLVSIAILVVAGMVAVGVGIWIASGKSNSLAFTGGRCSELGLVKIEGELSDPLPLIRQLRTLHDNPAVCGILLRVDSPGGTVGAAQEVYEVLEEFRGESYPVVASYGDVAASGGYYASLPSEKIFSNPGTMTASIGVIARFLHGEKLMDKIGVESEVVQSGALKDMGSPFRAPTEEERTHLSSVIMDSYEQFVGAVSRWRPTSIDTLLAVADGRVLTGRQAYALGLVDTLGGFVAASDFLAQRCGLDRVPKEFRQALPESPWMDRLLQSASTRLATVLQPSEGVLWRMP